MANNKTREAIFHDIPEVNLTELREQFSDLADWHGSACIVRDANEKRLSELHEELVGADWIYTGQPKYFFHPVVFKPYSYTGSVTQAGAEHGFSLCHRDVHPLSRSPFISALRQGSGLSDVIVVPPSKFDEENPSSAVDLNILDGSVTSDLENGLVTSKNLGTKVGRATLRAGDMIIFDVRNYHCTFTREAQRSAVANFYRRPFEWPSSSDAVFAE